MGDEAFFRALNDSVRGGTDGGAGGWGALGSGWDAVGFDAALEAPPRDDERLRLIGDLIDAFFTAARTVDAADGERFVPLDEGLSVMSRHAQALGYDALILFLDELVLWLASHAAEPAFVQSRGTEGREARGVHAVRPANPHRELHRAPARPARAGRGASARRRAAWIRRCPELVGSTVRHHHPGRPQPAGHRGTSRAAHEERGRREELEAAFEKTARVREEVLSTLLTRDG